MHECHSVRAVVLAAGKSTRFGTFNKLLIPLCGKPLITHITDLLQALGFPITVVVGHAKEQVMHAVHAREATATFVVQEKPLGTGDALLCSRAYWDTEHILVLNGDMPLITSELVQKLVAIHAAQSTAVSFIAAYPDRTNHAYGRVVAEGVQVRIIEAKDFTGDPAIRYPINAGIYIFKRSFLESYASCLELNNAQRQFYITDLIGIASEHNLGVYTMIAEYDFVRGVNTLAEFALVTATLRERLALHWLAQGVLIEDPATTFIDATVRIGEGTRIAPGVHMRGNSTIGKQCTIAPYVIIEDSTVADGVMVQSHTVLQQSFVASHASIGPFAHITHGAPLKEASVLVSELL